MPLNEFQQHALQEVEYLLGTLPHVDSTPFQEVTGKRETYLKGNIKGSKYILEVYLYEDEAGYFLNGRTWFPWKKWIIFEKPDFSSQEELLQAFLVDLRKKLS
jgi:hypothetical protein